MEEIREFALKTKPHVLCFTETKLSYTVNDEEINIEGYDVIRRDTKRHGGGVAYFVSNSIHFNQRQDFPKDFENIFIDIPKTTPILFGVLYRPPKTSDFLELLTNAFSDAERFDTQDVFLLGDFNINLLDRKMKYILQKGYRFSKDEKNYTTPLLLTKNYVEFLRTQGLTQLIKEPTRVTDKTATLLDHVLTNTEGKVTQSGVLAKAISDHDMTYCTRKTQPLKTGRHNNIIIRSLKKYNKETLIKNLNGIEFPNYSEFNCVNEAYQDLTDKVMMTTDKIAPFKEIRVKGNSKPWFDGEVVEKLRVRDKMKKKASQTKLQVDYDNFKCSQKHAKKLVSKKKREYVKEQISANIAKPSKLWKTLKSIGLPTKTKGQSKICLNENGEMKYEGKETSRIFKEFYENLAESLVGQLPPAKNKFNKDTTRTFYESFNIANKNF